MQRVDGGEPLRAGIAKAGLSIPKLAALTKEIDPDGRGLSASYIGFYASTGRSAREKTSKRAADLMTKALKAAGIDVDARPIFTDTA
ncbi:XRE family transcriptional regulator [Streptomyces sp. 4N509B]|uniref:XRE family transcriptional regulator n=1 Tax=Streptomyces sp. 4N509B TaxID=3457413 RepID=UPI003FD2F73B